jgi:hypothetical protein
LRTFLYKLDKPYSDCIKNTNSPDGFDSVFYKAMFNQLNMTTYRQKNCVRLCLQEFIMNQCKCVDAGLPNIWNVSICASLDSLDCIAQSRVDYFKNAQSSSCPQCPLECFSVNYYVSSSNSRYPTAYYTNYLRFKTDLVSRFPKTTIVSDNHIQKNIVIFNVFYDDLATVYVTELPESILFNFG